MTTILDDFKKYLQSQDLAKLTLTGYLSDLSLFIQWFEKMNRETFALERVTPSDAKEYKDYLLNAERRKANTINRKLAALSALMRWARETGQIQVDPLERIKGIRTVAGSPKWLDKHAQFSLQRAIEKDLQVSRLRFPKRWVTRQRDASLTIFMLHTGLRLNECMKLHLSDVEISDRKGSVLVQNGKGGKQRSIPLNAEARKALDEWLKVRPKGDDFLWVAIEADDCSGLTGRTVQRVLKRYAQDAGLDELTPHILRHTFAKNLVNNGVSLEQVAMLLGHSSLNTTRIYITPSQQDLQKAVEKLEQK